MLPRFVLHSNYYEDFETKKGSEETLRPKGQGLPRVWRVGGERLPLRSRPWFVVMHGAGSTNVDTC